MQLIRAEFQGFRRFKQARINLEGALLAVVGPNEAGKTSLLIALESVEDKEAYDPSDLTRGMPDKPSGSDIVVRLQFVLEERELDLLEEHPLTGNPHFMFLEKRADGAIQMRLEPEPKLDLSSRNDLIDRLTRTINNTRIRSFVQQKFPPYDGSDPQVAEKPLIKILRSLVSSLRSSNTRQIRQMKAGINRATQAVESAITHSKGHERRALERLHESLVRFQNIELGKRPLVQYCEALERLRPEIRRFTRRQRELKHEYPLNVLPNPPEALQNLFDLGDLRVTDLHRAYEDRNLGRLEGLEKRLNDTLHDIFSDTWTQSNVFPRFDFGDETIRLFVPTRDEFSSIAERSDGLRSFVALCAFTAKQSDERPLIALIDEAEQHLHYNAQADLVQVFERQEVVDKIIYTTHSAGCLPNDLGTRVRVIRPLIADDDNDTGRSEIQNSFWEEGAGFSTLMFAMGAGVLALVPTRRAVMAEGGSETILLPRLLREATGSDYLDFQVAPGLATVSNTQLSELDLEASKVVYLLDGDLGGDQHKKRLLDADIGEERIVQLPTGLVLEDFIEPTTYAEAVNDRLSQMQGADVEITAEDVRGADRFRNISTWCEAHQLDTPSKVSVARTIAVSSPDQSVLDAGKQDDLRKIAKQLEDALEV